MSIYAIPKDPQTQRLQEIGQLIQNGKLPAAAKKLNAAVKTDPTDPRVYLLGSRLAERSGNPQGAIELARRAVSVGPDWSVAVTELAFLLARQNQFADALAQATRAVELDSQSIEVMARVIDIAHRAQNFPQAIAWLRLALPIAPEKRTLELMLARDLRLVGDHEASLAAYDALLAANAGDAEALAGRLQTALALGRGDSAAKDGAALLALDPADEVHRFWHEVATGGTPATLPAAVVRALYDGFADLYDQHVVRSLGYQLPRQVGQIIQNRYPENKLNVLELGCGTGLLGVCLGRIDGALVGVDLSRPMIDQAIRHNVYDRFHNVNLLDALRETPDALYDVIAACDVFIYVGDLTQAIPNAQRVLKPGGQLIFSCEAAREDEADLVLRPALRYAHKRSAIEAQCRAAGFAEVSVEPTVLRHENSVPVEGFIVVAHKPA